MDRNFSGVIGDPPIYGYGYGAGAFAEQLRQEPPYPDTPYPAQLYGYSDDAAMRGMGDVDVTGFLQRLAQGVSNVASNVENVARGVSVGSQAAQQVIGRAASGGSTLFQPSAADVAARQYDVNTLLGLPMGPLVLIGGAALLLILLSRKRS